MAEKNKVQLNREPLTKAELEAKRRQAEYDKERRRVEVDDRLNTLAEKTADFIELYGEQDYRSQMMVSFLDVALEMKDVIETLTAVNVAMSCIFEAIEFIDNAINFDTELQQASLQHDYGLFARWKRRRRIRKVIRNTQNRMQAAVDNILAQQELGNVIIDSLRSATERMQFTMRRREEKRQKALAQKAEGGMPAPAAPSKAQLMIAEIMKARGTAPGGASSQPAPAVQPPKPQGGVGDISDIL